MAEAGVATAASSMGSLTGGPSSAGPTGVKGGSERTRSVTLKYMREAIELANLLKTSLGPRGADKLIVERNGEVVITNDGATMLKKLKVRGVGAKMIVELSRAQDIAVGDGTTSVVVLAGALLVECERLLTQGLHPSLIANGITRGARIAVNAIRDVSWTVNLTDTTELLRIAGTCLNSKIINNDNLKFATIAADAIKALASDPNCQVTSEGGVLVDVDNVRVLTQQCGTMDDSELIDGLAFVNRMKMGEIFGAADEKLSQITEVKVGLIQFGLIPPRTDIESKIVIKHYAEMDRLLKEERMHVAKSVKAIAATGCNVLMIQKSVLRDSVSDIALDLLKKANIYVIREIDRDVIPVIVRALGCVPVASLEGFSSEKLGSCKKVSMTTMGDGHKTLKFEGLKNPASCVTCIARGSNALVLDECRRSLHDAFCVMANIYRSRAIVPGGGVAEMRAAKGLYQAALTAPGADSVIFHAMASALEEIPSTIAASMGLNAVDSLSRLRTLHASGNIYAGLDAKNRQIQANMNIDSQVLQPVLVSVSAFKLASQLTSRILKIDGEVPIVG